MAKTKRTTLAIAGELIDSLRTPSEFWDAFKSVKFDTDDSDGYDGERVVVIVAKGDAAGRVAAAYKDSLLYERVLAGLGDPLDWHG